MCDTLIAINGGDRPSMVFGKNSDRPLEEAQPLQSVPQQVHPPGDFVRCQYLTIPHATETLAVLGSRPWWLWGFEQGLNEAGVVIGNQGIYTRDEVPDVGLLGMDLVRLGLERGATAADALHTITGLIEEHGQGGDCRYLVRRRYFNSFIVADGREAYVLETSGRHWVSKCVTSSTAIGNLVTIEDDWDACSDGIETYARKKHWWWGPPGRKLNFRAAFEDGSVRERTEARYRAGREFLASNPCVQVPLMMRHLRDHFEGGTIQVPERLGEQRPRTVCIHPGQFASATAASMVVELSPRPSGSPVAWCSMSPPCTSPFLPIAVDANLPAVLTVGGSSEDTRSAWWTLYHLARLVELDPLELAPGVQGTWSKREAELTQTVAGGELPDLEQLVNDVLQEASRIVETLDPRAVAAA
jgi:secernin